MEESTLGPVLKHKVEFARRQGRERQRELSRLTAHGASCKGRRSQESRSVPSGMERGNKVRKL